jgi:hypothetical protein
MAAEDCYITSDITSALRVAFIHKHIKTNYVRKQGGGLLLGN